MPGAQGSQKKEFASLGTRVTAGSGPHMDRMLPKSVLVEIKRSGFGKVPNPENIVLSLILHKNVLKCFLE